VDAAEAASGASAASAPPSAGRAPGARNETRGTVLANDVEHARSLWARFMGLMGRRSLEPGSGLWLTGTNGIHMFFMRFPIDAVFLGRPDPDGARRVLSTHRRVRPWIGIVPYIRGAVGVLELPVGAIDSSDTVPGDTVRIG
jgi:uncharacterized membrane protein (UPF0127 family)